MLSPSAPMARLWTRAFAYPDLDRFRKRGEDPWGLVGMLSSDSGYAREPLAWTGPAEMLPFADDACACRSWKLNSRPNEV